MANVRNYLILIECDNEKFDQASGDELKNTLVKMQEIMKPRGDMNIWQVDNQKAVDKFKEDIRRVMKHV